MEYIDIIKYFGKFPLKEGVLKNFTGDDLQGYAELQNYFTAMDPHSLIPDIKEFVITRDEKELGEKVKAIDGWFLLVEPGGISAGDLNSIRIRETALITQLTIGHHRDKRSLDPMATALLSDFGLNLTKQLLSYLETDDKNLCASKRWLDNPFQVDPVEPYLLFQSIGWQITLTRNYTSLL